LGAVFYELLAGRPAFAGSSVNEALAAVALATPPPVTDFREDASPALNAIVMKALAKNTAARYQTMADLARDLRNLLVGENALARGREDRTIIPQGAGRGDREGERLPPGSIIEDLKQALSRLFESKPQRQKALLAKTGLEEDRSLLGDIAQFWKLYKRYVLAGLLALFGIAIAVVIAGTLRDRLAGNEERRAMSVAHATTNGKVTNAAISPDGELLVYTVDEAAGQSLWLKELKGAKETRLAQAQPVEYSGLTFSPDGGSITYLKTPFDSGSGAVFRIAARGGAERPMPINGALSSVSFSPDGKRLAAIRMNDDGSEMSLWVSDETGAGVVLSARRGLAAFQPASPAWSPDGRVIVCAMRDADSDLFLKLVAISVLDKTESVIASGRWSEIDGMAWLADGRGLIVSAGDPVTRRSQLWQVEYSPTGAGEVSRVTRDLSDYRGVSLTRDSSVLVSAQSETLSNVWVNADQLRQITTGRQDGVNGIAWTPDGRLIYASLTGDRESLWMSDRRVEENNEESRHLPLPTESGDGGQYQPAVSPDGRFAVYVIERAGGAFLLRNEIERREFKPLTEDRLAFFPQFSPDGKWVIYSTNRGGRAVIARVSSDGGTPETLIAGRAWRPVVSPDGANLACNYLDETTSRWRLAVMPVSGGAPVAIFDAPGSLHRVVQWTPDGAGLAFVVTRGGVSNIWVQLLSGGAPAQLTGFKTGRIFNFAWSRDGKQLALAHGWASSDVALIRNFR
jgi:Tol biopolymer transport system component